MQTRKLYVELACTIDAFKRCRETGNTLWAERHGEHINDLMENMPHGSGFDSGTHLDWEHSTGEKIVLTTSFHHMNENGYYDGWTEHSVTVRPSLMFGFTLSISGRNRNDIKEVMYQEFDYILHKIVNIPPDPFKDVRDFERCVSCYGTASLTAKNGLRYCQGCSVHVEKVQA